MLLATSSLLGVNPTVVHSADGGGAVAVPCSVVAVVDGTVSVRGGAVSVTGTTVVVVDGSWVFIAAGSGDERWLPSPQAPKLRTTATPVATTDQPPDTGPFHRRARPDSISYLHVPGEASTDGTTDRPGRPAASFEEHSFWDAG
ncbi:MAG TPA: hypothetical protein VGR26_00150, partial [Acidimicrobiales bacterium]|nr:hypothetical protein [Acidimicrobiales bacterium]